MTRPAAVQFWMRRGGRLAAALLLLTGVAAAGMAATRAAAAPAPRLFLTDVSGAIGVATVRQISRAIERAQAERGEALIIRLDTPGGLVSSTRELIKLMIGAPLPIVVYVAPSGARAASAGTFIVYASHVAAMAPGTNLGAATPIEIGGLPGLPQPRQNEPGKDDKGSSAPAQTAAQRKAINDVVALLRSLAQLRNRNSEFAEKAVSDAATMTATEAQKAGVIDVVATSVDDLLTKIDGRKVSVDGVEKTLSTRGAKVEPIEPDLRTRLLSTISDPNIAFLLLMIGFYGLILEFWNPGSFAPGVIGAICLILALTALSALPVNYGSLALIVLGIALMIGEVFTPGIGVLGIGGLIAFVAGAYFLFEGAGADIEIAVSLPLIAGMAFTTAALIFGVIGAAVKARQRPTMTGAEQVIGAQARVVDWDGASGHVRFNGEIWSARAPRPLTAGAIVRITGREGLTLMVEASGAG